MQFFKAKVPCPYLHQPCVALSRFETPVYEGPDCEERQELVEKLAAFKAEVRCDTVVGFDGQLLEGQPTSSPSPLQKSRRRDTPAPPPAPVCGAGDIPPLFPGE